MNDDRMEELLRKTWQPEPPEGMRDRVLARAYEKMAKRRGFDFSWMLGWKPVLAALGIVIVLLVNMDDNRREARVAALIGDHGAHGTQARVAQCYSFEEWQRRQSEIISRLDTEMEDRRQL